MNKTIHKYAIMITSHQQIAIPSGAEIIKAGLDPNAQPSIWAIVDTDAEKVFSEVFVKGTGIPLYDVTEASYVDTFNQGQFVLHVFIKQ